MAEPAPGPVAPNIQLPKMKRGLPTSYGLVVLLVVLVAAVAMYLFMSEPQYLEPTPQVLIERGSGQPSSECQAGETCVGPTVTAQDPEGDQLTYKFYDRETGEQVAEVKADSGQAVTPEFNFDSSGEKNLYMVVEDGAGHTSKDYPIIIPVK